MTSLLTKSFMLASGILVRRLLMEKVSDSPSKCFHVPCVCCMTFCMYWAEGREKLAPIAVVM